jgi:hypothetical protein
VLIGAGVVAIVVIRQHPGNAAAGGTPAGPAATRPGHNGQASARLAAAARSQAADWVTREVSKSAIVACDPAMCAALQAAGLPAANFQVLSATAADPLGADLVVATPAVRTQFGTRLASVYAPAVMAQFGTGAAQIAVRVVASNGAAAYRTELSQDVLARKSVAAQLLSNRKIRVTASARTELAAGQVDARLLLTLAALANKHRVSVLSFGDLGPGADPQMPLCSAELAGSDHPASMSQSSYVSWLQAFLRGQRPPFNSQISAARQQGQAVVSVKFAMPSPLGLLKDG